MTDETPPVDAEDYHRAEDNPANDHRVRRRRRTPARWRALGERALPALARRLVTLLWSTCRLRIEGGERLDALIDADRPFIACYWHGEQIFCVRALLERRAGSPALKLGYLISPSRDGDAAARVFDDLHLHVIRGSATRGGAQAMREIYQAIRRDGVSPIVTPDGPTGPRGVFKPGVAMLASLAGAPIVPLGSSAAQALTLSSWDRARIPLPFSRVVVRIGAPFDVPRGLSGAALEAFCVDAARAIDELGDGARAPAPSRPASGAR